MKKTCTPEVSIIVPVYNVEKYLRQCLESIESQTFTDWECVVVDDGSTDRSGEICDEFARRDPRFKVLHVKNGGLASARNNGIRESQGKYIAFCDSDDWLEPHAIATMHELIVSNDADIVQTGLWKDFDGYSRVKHLVKNRMVFDREQAIMELCRDKIIPSYVWNKMFKREIVGPDFPVGKNFEDIYVDTKWFSKITKMVCDPTPLYHYRMRAGSILHVGSTKNRLDFLDVMRFRADEVAKLGLKSFGAAEHDALITKAAVSSAKMIARREPDAAKRIEVVNSISEIVASIPMPSVKALGLNMWLRVKLLRKSPKAFIRLMRGAGNADIHSQYRTRKMYS